MPSQLMSHSTLYIGKVKTVSPLFFLTIGNFADFAMNANQPSWAETT